uniref:Uncharacterized protein n=1 Tax=Rhizophora mucronata TaxID=61149 RepID=A0A2P2NID2_RHIMU
MCIALVSSSWKLFVGEKIWTSLSKRKTITCFYQ